MKYDIKKGEQNQYFGTTTSLIFFQLKRTSILHFMNSCLKKN